MSVKKLQINYNTISAVGKWKVQPYPTVPEINLKNKYKNEKLRSFIETMMSWMDVKGLCAVLMAIATRTSTFFELKKIEVPALIIAGKLDMVTPPVRSFYMNENLKNSVLNIIPAAGHLSNMEAPEVFNNAVEKFLLNLG